MLKKISIVALALAFAGCATPPKQASVPYAGNRTLASTEGYRSFFTENCDREPCVYVSVPFNGSQMTIAGKGFNGRKSAYDVNIYVYGQNGRLERIGAIKTDHGSFSYTTPTGTVGWDTKLQVKVLLWDGPGKANPSDLHWQGEVFARTQSNQDQTTTRTGGKTQAQIDAENAKIRKYAGEQALAVATRVALTYGALENWRYNFSRGTWKGGDDYINSATSHDDFQTGYNAGLTQGENAASAAKTAGGNDGRRDGSSQGSLEADRRYQAIVNTSNHPNLSVDIVSLSIPQYNGATAPANTCNGADSRKTELQGALITEMKTLRFGDSDFYLPYDSSSFDLTFKEIEDWGQDNYEFTQSYFRTDNAWEAWKHDKLGGRYDRSRYEKLDYDGKNVFNQEFERVYDDTIDEKYQRVKTARNDNAFLRGAYYGREIMFRKNQDQGCNKGFSERYAEKSKLGYPDGYKAGYQTGFKNRSDYYDQNAIISVSGIGLTDANHNGVYSLGEAIGVRVGKASNLGRIPANDLQVRLTGDGITETPRSDARISIPPSTSRDINQELANLATIRQDLIADHPYAVHVAVGNNAALGADLSFTVNWRGSIEGLASGSMSDALKNFVEKNIKDEFITNYNQGNNHFYGEGKAPSKLLDLVELCERTPAAQRANFIALGKDLTNWELADHQAHKHWYTWVTKRIRKEYRALVVRMK